MKKIIFVYLLLCLYPYSFADNPVCNNTEEYGIDESGCYSFGDEFVFIGKEWPEYNNGEKNLKKAQRALKNLEFQKIRISKNFPKMEFIMWFMF